MKAFLVAFLICFFASAEASAKSPTPIHEVKYYAYAPFQTHYHDKLGQYFYNYNDGQSSKFETKTHDGTTRGHYSYIDSQGKLQSVVYTVDKSSGYRVAGTNIPKGIPAHIFQRPVVHQVTLLNPREAKVYPAGFSYRHNKPVVWKSNVVLNPPK